MNKTKFFGFTFFFLTVICVICVICVIFLVREEKNLHESKIHPKNGLIYENSTSQLYNGYIYQTYSNGKIREKYRFRNGDYNGESISYFENGKISSTGNLKNGLSNGTDTYYYEDGKVRLKQNYIDTVLNGEYIQYYPNGQVEWESDFKNGKMHGIRTRYYENGNLQEVGFLDCGFWFGERKTYYENGNLEEKAIYDADKLHGLYESYYKNASIKTRGTYFFGKENGTFYYYNNEEKIEEERNYKNGKQHGISKRFYNNGNIQEKCSYKNGKKNGECINFRLDKTIISKSRYNSGEKYQRIVYSPDGKVISDKTNYPSLYQKTGVKHEKIEVEYFNGAFTSRKYDSQVIYPFLKKFLGDPKEYKDHLVYDGLCKKIAGLMNPMYMQKYLYYAKQKTAKNKDDVISTLFLFYAQPQYWNQAEWSRRLDLCMQKVDQKSFYRYLLTWCKANIEKKKAPFKKLREIAFSFAANNILSKRESQYIYRLIFACTPLSDKTDLSYLISTINKDNIWLKKALIGLNNARTAWLAMGNNVRFSEDNKKKNSLILKNAKKQLIDAWDMHKDLPETAYLLISVSMLNGSVDDSITWFNRCTVAQIDYNQAYDLMTLALCPKWNGSADLLQEIGDSCYDSSICMDKIENNIPLKMLAFYRLAAFEYKNYLWQSPYRNKENIKKIKKCLKYWLGNNNQDSNRYQSTLAIFCYYAGEYSIANNIIQRIGIQKFSEIEKDLKKNNWQYFNYWINVADNIKYYTESTGKLIIKAEKCFYNGNRERGLNILDSLIRKANLNKKTKTFVKKLRHCYSLNVPASQIPPVVLQPKNKL